MSFFTRLLRALLTLSAVVAVGSLGLFGCGDDSGANSGGNGGNSGAVDPNTVVKSTFTDSRDRQTYKTVKIGSQKWMAENLNYNTADGVGSWCYDQGITIDENTGVVTVTDGQENCVKYGRLYTWAAARTACPNGWRLPDTADWGRLERSVGGHVTVECYIRTDDIGNEMEGDTVCHRVSLDAGKKLKSTNGWNDYNGQSSNGTDDYGFSALPGGIRRFNDDFTVAGYYGVWWTATVNSDGNAYLLNIVYDDGVIEINSDMNPSGMSYGLSVRCLQD